MALASWEAFEQLKGRLVSDHGFVDEPRQVQRLVFTAEGDGAGTTVDLVPFGALQVNRHTLVWPPELAEGLMVKVASLPGLAILKLFAWGDRRQRDAKDAVAVPAAAQLRRCRNL